MDVALIWSTIPATVMTHSTPKTREADGSGAMFDRIARRYDRMNRVISLGTDKRWRRRLVNALSLSPGMRVLDVATGTADVALAIASAIDNTAVAGIDPSHEMLAVGREKIQNAQMADRIQLVAGDAQSLPFDDHHFDACAISFGIRNVPDRLMGLQEMVRVTRPGGTIAVLELGIPRGHWLSPFARLHMRYVMPQIGAIVAGRKEYRYLQESIDGFPTPEDFSQLMVDAGLVSVEATPLTFGAAWLFVGKRPTQRSTPDPGAQS